MAVDTDFSLLLDWTENCGKMGTNAHGKVDLAHTTQETELEKTMTLRLGIDATLKARTAAITPCWNCRCQWSTACVHGALRSTALAVE